MDVTTWYLEQTSPSDLVTARTADVAIIRSEIPSPEFNRFLYQVVGQEWHWTDRLPWTREQWVAWLDRGVETWVAYEHGTPAGYVELDPQPEGVLEIAYFGLLPHAIGRGIGGHLLSYGTARAWDFAGRNPGRAPTERVFVHTCSLDGPAALPNYQARGFRIFRTVVEPAKLAETMSGPGAST
ncbi:GNAT family N-acetyltransferase [Streptosporangiaceae bacterium NEAU-GS5]|nr:GNAT family N-acetyltransferase [Streptosporangiaceae bacterium NEAU-GS5]